MDEDPDRAGNICLPPLSSVPGAYACVLVPLDLATWGSFSTSVFVAVSAGQTAPQREWPTLAGSCTGPQTEPISEDKPDGNIHSRIYTQDSQ